MGALVINGQKVAGVNIEIKPEIYSTEEREIGVWTDGKPLYQRTIQGTVNVTSTSRNWYTLLPVSSLPNLGNVVPIDGSYIIDSGDGQVYPIPMTTGISQGASTSCVYNTSEGLRVCLEGVSAGTSNYSITLQYTKTTDQAGAGTWTPDGVPAVHYSTDEKVIGTWIDGSTIYEKTINCGTLPNATSKTVAHNISNLDKIVLIKGVAYETTNGNTLPMPYLNADNFNYTVQLEVNSTNVVFNTKIDFTQYTSYITIQYTKSS